VLRHTNIKSLNNLITDGEECIPRANVERKHQWLKLGLKPIPIPKAVFGLQKWMLCVWWGIEGVLYREMLHEKATMNARRYRAQLHKLDAEVQQKRPRRSKVYINMTIPNLMLQILLIKKLELFE
jgi:hypothetical protein